METIMELAKSMGLSADSQKVQELAQPQVIEQMSQAFHQTEQKEHRQESLCKALLPYLQPNRKRRLEQAMQISRLSRLAGVALQSGWIGAITEKEDDHV